MKKSGCHVPQDAAARYAKSFGVNIISVGGKSTLPKFDHEIGVNISCEGMIVKSERRIRSGTRVRVKVMLVRGHLYRIVETPAQVAWCERSFDRALSYYLGLKFTSAVPDRVATIEWFFR